MVGHRERKWLYLSKTCTAAKIKLLEAEADMGRIYSEVAAYTIMEIFNHGFNDRVLLGGFVLQHLKKQNTCI